MLVLFFSYFPIFLFPVQYWRALNCVNFGTKTMLNPNEKPMPLVHYLFGYRVCIFGHSVHSLLIHISSSTITFLKEGTSLSKYQKVLTYSNKATGILIYTCLKLQLLTQRCLLVHVHRVEYNPIETIMNEYTVLHCKSSIIIQYTTPKLFVNIKYYRFN